jgi:tRNA threonylcarbamoyladenosine modification (KEOPS) complex  Pcc1 subunit
MSNFCLETKIIIRLPNQGIAKEYFASIAPELENSPKGRAITTSFPPHDGIIEFTITAQDFSAARAAYNSIINYLKIVDDTYNLANNPKGKV